MRKRGPLRMLLLIVSAFSGLATTASGAAVVFGGDVAGFYRARPSGIHLTSDQNIVHIRWALWGGSTARGNGTLRFSAADMTAPVSLRLELSRNRKCGTRNQYLRLAFRELSGRDRGHLTVVHYSCHSPF